MVSDGDCVTDVLVSGCGDKGNLRGSNLKLGAKLPNIYWHTGGLNTQLYRYPCRWISTVATKRSFFRQISGPLA